MKLYELVQKLNEYKSTPSSLKMMASRINALAGMELEMFVPGDENYDDQEPDFDQDERVYGIDDAYAFFDDGNYNGRREVQQLRSIMQEEYAEWLLEHASDQYDEEDEEKLVREYILDNVITLDDLKEQWMEEERTSEDQEFDDAEVLEGAHELLNAMVEEALDSDPESYRENTRDEWMNDWLENADEEQTWLRSQNITHMSDIINQWDEVIWPHYVSESEANLDFIEQEITRLLGRDGYSVTTDSSLGGEGPEPGMAGIEIISPPLPVTELLSDFQKLVQWSRNNGGQTNDATGLHMNVSVPNYDRDNLDYLKLAILIGDEYVLEKFGRLNNTRYTASAIRRIRNTIRSDDGIANVEEVFRRMKAGMDQLATKLIHTGHTSKFVSINTKQGWVEFRAPGGDWLDMDIDELDATMYRYVVALDAAMDPNKFRKEYLKKLYKLFAGAKDSQDVLTYFAQYTAGTLTKEDLKHMINSIRQQRGNKPNRDIEDAQSQADIDHDAVQRALNPAFRIGRAQDA